MAVLVFILNQRGQIRQERRQARLARINSQVRELYGPLNAMVDVNERIWEALRDSELPPQIERRPDVGTESWQRWRDGALMPANRRMRDLIVENADLLVGTEVPQVLRDFCAHVTSAEVILIAEAKGKSERPLIPHPGAAYVDYVRKTFISLKLEQQQLLRTMIMPRQAIEHNGELHKECRPAGNDVRACQDDSCWQPSVGEYLNQALFYDQKLADAGFGKIARKSLRILMPV